MKLQKIGPSHYRIESASEGNVVEVIGHESGPVGGDANFDYRDQRWELLINGEHHSMHWTRGEAARSACYSPCHCGTLSKCIRPGHAQPTEKRSVVPLQHCFRTR